MIYEISIEFLNGEKEKYRTNSLKNWYKKIKELFENKTKLHKIKHLELKTGENI